MELCYPVIKLGCTISMNVFFKDLSIIGIENIPKKGPVIICGNHANQFLDAGLMLSSAPRPVSFIVAAKSYRKYLVGTLAKALRAIPVERPQDIAKEGTGIIVQIKDDILVGLHTRFLEEIQPGDVLKVKDIPVDIVVKDVLSNTEVSYMAENDITQQGIKNTFKIYPKLDQTEVYDSVWQKLKKGRCVGIFPEGGSHDRTELLPLKAGICVMALGAMAKNSKPVKIVPCGLNYFKGYNFRSKAIVEFGVPYEVPKSLLDLYLKNKKEGIAALLTEIEKRLKAVTITSPTYNELSSVYLARKLYVPAHYSLTPHEEHLLNQTLALGYNELKENPEVKNLFESVRKYHLDLRKLRLEDSAVKRISSKKWKNVGRSLLSILILLVNGVFVLPGLALNGPIGLIIKLLSERERRKALKDSNVKVKGTDVMGSLKVLYSVIAFPVAAVMLTAVFRLLLTHLFRANKSNRNKFTVLFLIFWALYSYLMVLASDVTVKHYRTLKARINLFISKEKMERLRETRKGLQKRVTDFVNKHLNLQEDPSGYKPQPIERIRKSSEDSSR